MADVPQGGKVSSSSQTQQVNYLVNSTNQNQLGQPEISRKIKKTRGFLKVTPSQKVAKALQWAQLEANNPFPSGCEGPTVFPALCSMVADRTYPRRTCSKYRWNFGDQTPRELSQGQNIFRSVGHRRNSGSTCFDFTRGTFKVRNTELQLPLQGFGTLPFF